jgi:hypothetical protein
LNIAYILIKRTNKTDFVFLIKCKSHFENKECIYYRYGNDQVKSYNKYLISLDKFTNFSIR